MLIFKQVVLILLSVFLLIQCNSAESGKRESSNYNILFIAIDDLRPSLGCYDDQIALTPNIDKLASVGTVFLKAYCQQAVCNPSRASLMTGLRPDQLGVWDLQTHFRDNNPDIITLPQYFKQQGYHAREIGKIYHDPLKAKDPPSWSGPSILHVTQNGRGHKYVLDKNIHDKGWKAAATEMADVPDTAYIDGKVCQAAIKLLNEIKDSTFFLAVGFRRPHLPFTAPKKYWDIYKPKEIPPVKIPLPPENVPDIALHNWKELRGYTDMPAKGNVSQEKAEQLRWGYYAAISYVDAQIGRLINELRDLDLYENTVIVLWGDHGFHLGEHNLWCKITNFELDTRVPLIISTPDQISTGSKTNAIVEFVDIYPTLADVCGLRIPEGLAGKSLKPLLDDPATVWNNSALSQFPRPGYYQGKPELMGYSLRNQQFRFTKWIDIETGETTAGELYDHKNDPYESVNLIEDQNYKKIIQKLDEELEEKISDGLKRVQNHFSIQ